ncbi:probable E3 ubiquitin-protein ligase RHG1A [Durio zibethinus]|uniref:RING-type E3 ubiquitin transferase n=1 Tax=Durio zibethinus TaxID=66656 RepID=A0A6P5ZID2_DURZI|nr:probable E3 ubiquitin-protein ligase RHG1A [Durio zibethinus]
MQGQGQQGSSNSFRGNFYFNDVLPSDQHDVVPNAVDNNGDTSMSWIGQPISGLDAQNHVSFGQVGDDLWLSPLRDQPSTVQSFEERHFNEPNFNPFQQNINASPSTVNPFLDILGVSHRNGHISSEHGPIGPSSVFPGQEESSDPLQHNLDLNAVVQESRGLNAVVQESRGQNAVVHESRGQNASQDNGPYLSLDLFRTGTGAGNRIRSSSPVLIYSGVAEYAVEENINREGLPTDGQRRLLCKRREPEFASGQVNSSSSTWQVGNSEQSRVTAQDNVISSLNASSSLNNRLNSSHSGILVAPPAPSNLYHILNEAGQVDDFQRNTRLRRTESQQNPTPLNLWTLNSSNSNVQATGQPSVFSPLANVQATGQPLVFSPFDRFTITSSALAPVPVNPAMQPIVQFSNSLHAPQPYQNWNGTTMSLVGSSSTSPDQTVYVREALGLEENSRNNRRNMMIPSANMQANLNLANGSANFIGNIASSSRIQPGTGVYLPTSSTRYPQPNMAEQHAQRVRDIVDRSEDRRLWNYRPVNSGASLVVRELDFSERGGNVGTGQVPQRLGQGAERQGRHHSEVSPTVQFETADQRRRRQLAELRNVLGIGRRHGVIHREDSDPSFLNDMPEEPDNHDDMRLDVDSLSYEELLFLEEQIGDVCTGLSEEFILAYLRRRNYQSITIGPPVEAETCCICQEEYGNGEELGMLDCGHDFHFDCIKQWLVQKNSCPICKRTALANREHIFMNIVIYLTFRCTGFHVDSFPGVADMKEHPPNSLQLSYCSLQKPYRNPCSLLNSRSYIILTSTIVGYCQQKHDLGHELFNFVQQRCDAFGEEL